MSEELPQWARENPTTDTRAGKFPVPCTWVLGGAEADTVIWRRYQIASKYHERERDIPTKEALPSPDAVASLSIDLFEAGSGFDAELSEEYCFEVEGREVFCVRDADWDDVVVAIVEALRAIDLGDDFEDLDGIRPDSGEVVVSQQDERRAEIDKRREQNAGLGDFA